MSLFVADRDVSRGIEFKFFSVLSKLNQSQSVRAKINSNRSILNAFFFFSNDFANSRYK